MRQEMMGFWDGGGISWTTCKQSAPCARQTTTSTPHQSIFTGQMLFLMPSQQCRSTECNFLTCTEWNSRVKKWSICVSLYHERFFSGALWKNTFSPHVRFWVEKALSRCRARQPNLWFVSMLILCDILVDWWLPSSVVLGFCASSLTGCSCH